MFERIRDLLDGLGWKKYLIVGAALYAVLAVAVHVCLVRILGRSDPWVAMGFGFIAFLAVIICIFLYKSYIFEDEISVYGSARFMNRTEAHREFVVHKPTKVKGIPFGGLPTGKGYKDVVCMKAGLRENENVLIVGESGKGKTRSLILPAILQCGKAGDSMVITDPKGELYKMTSARLSAEGYKIYPLVLKKGEMKYGLRYNPLGDLEQTGAKEQANIIFACSGMDEKGTDFWVRIAKHLLEALIKLVAGMYKEPTYGDIYGILTHYQLADIRSMFVGLPSGHPALQAWNMLASCDDKLLSSTIIELGTIISPFAEEEVNSLTAASDIDAAVPAAEKCAVFIICDTQSSAYDFLTTLFLKSCIKKVLAYQGTALDEGKEVRTVRFILDELANISHVLDIERTLNVMRAYKVSAIAACQSIGQLRTIAGDKNKAEILRSAFAYTVALGSSDMETMEHFANESGISTVVSASYDDNGAVKHSYAPRKLVTPDEVMRLPKDELLLFKSGTYPLRLKKLNFTDFVTEKLTEQSHTRRAAHPEASSGIRVPDKVVAANKDAAPSGWRRV